MKALMAMGQIMLVMAITGTTACTTRPPVGERPVGAFLSEAERPDLLALLPAPPEDETPLAAADSQASEQALSLANTARCLERAATLPTRRTKGAYKRWLLSIRACGNRLGLGIGTGRTCA